MKTISIESYLDLWLHKTYPEVNVRLVRWFRSVTRQVRIYEECI